MDRFRETSVSTAITSAARCEDLHTLDFILPRTFVFEMHVFMGSPWYNGPEFRMESRWQLHYGS